MLPISLQRELAYGEPGVRSALRGSAFLSALGWLSIQIGTGSSAQGRVGPGKVHPKVGTGSSAQERVHPRSAHPGRLWVLGSAEGPVGSGKVHPKVGTGSSAQERVHPKSALGPRLSEGSCRLRKGPSR